MAITVKGTVRSEKDAVVQGAAVRLVGPMEVLAAGAVGDLSQPERIAWARLITDFSGHRWHCWQRFVRDQVSGITWEEFMDQVVEQNPMLEEDGYIFHSHKTYILPENVTDQQPGLFWIRTLRGFTGNRWQAWDRFVRGKVVGISWGAFLEEVGERNPQLEADGWIFRREKSYVLPQNVDLPALIAEASTDGAGAFAFSEVPTEGTYQMLVQVEGYRPLSRQIEVAADTEISLTLEALAVEPEPLPAVSDIVQASGGQFRLDGRPIRFIGANTRGLVHYGDPDILGGHTRQGDRQAQLDAVARMGGRVVRVFLANHRRSASEVADRLAETLQLLDVRDLYMIVAFADVHSDTPFRVQGDDSFYTEHGMLNRAFFAGGYRQNYLPFVRHIVGRFKEHTRIFAWELGNELKAQEGGNVLPDLFATFAHDVAKTIRALDGVHLITTGIINSGNLAMGSEQARRLYGDANLDFLTVHVYPDVPNSPEIPRADAEVGIARQVGKPLIIEEIGFSHGDRVTNTRAALNRWFDEKSVASVMQWGLMATPRDNGDGDVRFGMDPGALPGHNDFEGLVNVYRERANVLGF